MNKDACKPQGEDADVPNVKNGEHIPSPRWRERYEMRIFDFAAGEDGGWMAWSECSESDYLHYDGRRADVQVRKMKT